MIIVRADSLSKYGFGLFGHGVLERLKEIDLIRISTASILAVTLSTAAAGQALAAEFKIVTQQSPQQARVTTHEISSGNVILGISEFGGGYINKLYIPSVGNIVSTHAARYGRGGQVAIRDRLHGGRYNPTQGGFTDTAGTNVVIDRPANGRLLMPARPVSLWNGDGQYDFTEWENLARDPYHHDGGNSDSDGIDESQLKGKQATEITSEFDLTVSYDDVRDGKVIRIPAFRIAFEFRFVREPGHALRQFRKGTPAYDASAEVADRSRQSPPGNHPSTEDSLTGLILSSTLRGDIAVLNPTVVFLLNDQGKLVATRPERSFRQPMIENSRVTKSPLAIVSSSADLAQGPAIGYYYPHNHNNQYSIVGRSIKDHSIVYEDARAVTGEMLGSVARTPNMWLIGARTEHTGLLSRKETPSGVYEAIRGESYILIGSPSEIVEAARAIHPFP